ncbi:MAG: glucokinase [Desulfovibrionaceae bacterium]|nr:glucokinase [Desulfovibrionaceae bacterium]
MTRILAADIGGTNARFAVFKAAPGRLEPAGSVWLATGGFGSMAALLDAAREALPGPEVSGIDLAVFAVAGPVRGRTRCSPPNIIWSIDLEDPGCCPGLGRVALINDFTAQAFACRTEAVAEAVVLQPGRPDPEAALAVIGAGTALGHCALIPHGRGFVAAPSEAGHAAFAFVGRAEEEFHAFLLKALDLPYAYADKVVSGPGLSLLHRFLTGRDLTPDQVARDIDPQGETCRWFARFYGRACRNYALAVLASGGVYVSGGVAARCPALVEHPEFLAEFANSPRHRDLLEDMPVYLNRNEDSGLFGAAFYGLLLLEA